MIEKVLLLLAAQRVLLSASQADVRSELEFIYVLSPSTDPVYEVTLESTVPAVDLALQLINNDSTLLPGYYLSYRKVRLEQCRDGSLFAERSSAGMLSDIGILGSICPEETSTHTQILFTPSYEEESISSEDELPGLYRIHPTSETYARALMAFLHDSNWQRLSVLSRGGTFFDNVQESVYEVLESYNISVVESEALGNITDYDFPKDVRIFFLNMNTRDTVHTLCQAYRAKMLFPHFVWITYSRNYTNAVLASSLYNGCTAQQLFESLDGTFSLVPAVMTTNHSQQVLAAPEIITLAETAFEENNIINRTVVGLDYFAFDSVLIMANALNRSLDQTNASSDGFLQTTSIHGLTGDIAFDRNGNRELHTMGLTQFRKTLVRDYPPQEELIAVISVSLQRRANFGYIVGENQTTVFKGSVPSDGTPIKDVSILPIPLIVIYFIIASLGILFTVFCLLFMIIFRDKKIIKLTSPNLNYFIMVGALLLYSSTYFRFYPSKSTAYAEFLCNYQVYATCLGYVLVFAPILVKMWRVFYIFHNPRPGKKPLKDWVLVLIVFVLVGTILIIITIGTAFSQLRPAPTLVADKERPTGKTSDGITIHFCSFECYNGRLVPLIWTAVSFVYLVLLQVAAFILAIITRKVKIRVLNDFKEVSIIVYITSVVLAVLAGITFGLSSYLIVTETLFTGGVILTTTVVLFFLFVPKMVLLYRDPKGEEVFATTTREKKSQPTQMDSTAGYSLTISNKVSN